MVIMIRFCYVIVFAILLLGCARQVQRINPDEQVDLSGRWNDVDSKQVSEAMITDVMSRPWRETFFLANERKPVVIVGFVENKTHEHIDEGVFIKDLERNFVNTGLIRLVQNATFREKVRGERADQQEFASLETQKKWGNELGADFMLFGTISAVVDAYKRRKITFYKVNLILTDMETNETVWIGDKEIKKFQKN